MKVFQYRFSNMHIKYNISIGECIRDSFIASNDLEVNAIFLNKEGILHRKTCPYDRIPAISADSFSSSFHKKIRIENYFSIKSKTSCKFVVFEDDGLVRICFRSEDNENIFRMFGVHPEHISNLLIESDLFDYL